MPEHPLTPIVRTFFTPHFKHLDVEFNPPDDIICEQYITVQGTKPTKKGQTIYGLTFKISELEREILTGEGLKDYLTKQLAGVFETKDLSDYYKTSLDI